MPDVHKWTGAQALSHAFFLQRLPYFSLDILGLVFFQRLTKLQEPVGRVQFGVFEKFTSTY